MKKAYTKPQISVEELSLDRPIALNCSKDILEEMRFLVSWGYFGENDKGLTCSFEMKDMDGDHDHICYHTSVEQAFLS